MDGLLWPRPTGDAQAFTGAELGGRGERAPADLTSTAITDNKCEAFRRKHASFVVSPDELGPTGPRKQDLDELIPKSSGNRSNSVGPDVCVSAGP